MYARLSITYVSKKVQACDVVPIKATLPSAINKILSKRANSSDDGWCNVTTIVLPRATTSPLSPINRSYTHTRISNLQSICTIDLPVKVFNTETT